MYILGINAYHGSASACLIRDGELIAAEEERFKRVKYWAGFPAEARAIVQGEVFKIASEQGSTLERTRQLRLRQKALERLPPLVRPLVLFFYQYLLQLGFLDGIPVLVYLFLHAFWYPFLVAAKTMELKEKPERAGQVR